ncbi:MAG: hypothetical protein JNL02_00055 [Saprospiraceae bacterium]|nr:hypothetical protein [Saprospiraceae bacterium]
MKVERRERLQRLFMYFDIFEKVEYSQGKRIKIFIGLEKENRGRGRQGPVGHLSCGLRKNPFENPRQSGASVSSAWLSALPKPSKKKRVNTRYKQGSRGMNSHADDTDAPD